MLWEAIGLTNKMHFTISLDTHRCTNFMARFVNTSCECLCTVLMIWRKIYSLLNCLWLCCVGSHTSCV